jgi:hypothetical protein
MSSSLLRPLLMLLALLPFSSAIPLHAEDAMVPEMGPAPEAVTATPDAAPAPEVVTMTPWQDVISGQIQAFRDHDAPVAFSFAGAGFQVTYPSAEAFFNAIVTSGYAPIMESKSHSFGPYEMVGEMGVVQEVRFTGLDQSLYRAVYQLTKEPEGWRVQGVQLVKEAGIAI